MAHKTEFQVQFQKRSTQGLDQYEHEQAGVTANVTLDDEDTAADVAAETVDFVRAQVYRALGLKTPKGHQPEPAPASPRNTPAPPNPASPRNAPAPPNPASAAEDNPSPSGPTDENGNPILPTKTNGVRGQNAELLANHLLECAKHLGGKAIPEAQIKRLPQKWADHVRSQIANIGHPDAETSGGEGAPASGSGGDDDPLGLDGDTPAAASGSGAAASGSGATADDPSGIDDLMGTPQTQPLEDITDDALQGYLRQYAQRFGGSAPVREVIQTFTNGGAATIPASERPRLLEVLEAKAREHGA